MARKVLIWVTATLILANLTIAIVVIFGSKPTPPPALPNPNGYSDFVRAGQLVSGDPGNYSRLTREELAALVATNAPALQTVRLGLTRESRVPVEYTPEYAEQMGSKLGSFKQLAYLLAAESRLAESEGRTNDAAKICVEGMRFGEETGRGGLLIQRLVAVACEAIAANRLDSPAFAPDAATCRNIVRDLQRMDEAEEPIANTIEFEREYSKKAHGLRGRIAYLLAGKAMQPALGNASIKANANTLHRRALMAKFAARAYELENGKRPESWTNLVPGYLKAIPKDPTSGASLLLPQ